MRHQIDANHWVKEGCLVFEQLIEEDSWGQLLFNSPYSAHCYFTEQAIHRINRTWVVSYYDEP